jgi:UDP-N-acetylglucosamine acyltransferase
LRPRPAKEETDLVKLHPTALVHPNAQLGEDVHIGPYCVVGEHVALGDRTRLSSHVVIDGHTTIGADCAIYSFAALGHPPQDLGYKGEPTRLIIGDRVLMREHVTMHPGTPKGRGETRVGSDCMFMVHSHIAHDCIVGDKCVFANGVQVGGHVRVDEQVWMGGLAAIHQHCRIGKHAFVGGMATVVADVIPFGSVIGNHARLAGLNIVGMKRRGFSRKTIHDLRAAYRMLYAQEGSFQERIDDVIEAHSDVEEVMTIINFIRSDAARALCMPE